MNWSDNIQVFNSDCLEAMKDMKDNEFDLAIVDPPYGIGNFIALTGYKSPKFGAVEWNENIPSIEYFNELYRVSENQIIWGANYFNCFGPQKNGVIVWDKGMRNNNKSMCEIASSSFHNVVRYVQIYWLSGFYRKQKEDIIHECQKPIQLYKWILDNYGKEGDKILDTHLGSGSIAIACHNRGFQLTGYEIDKDYYQAANKRFKQVTAQKSLF